MNELELVDRLRRLSGKGRGVIRGIGDDCAVFRPKAGEDLLLKTDQLIEGIHFPNIASASERWRAHSAISPRPVAILVVAWLPWLFPRTSPSSGSSHTFADYCD
jgi:thiamine-monophosphate kinase